MDFVAIDFETANEKRNSACSIGLTVVKDNKIALEAQFQEVVEINRKTVGGMSYHVAVEDDQMFQRARQGENGDDRVVLLLLAYKDEADFSVVDHVFNLRRAAVGEKRNGDGSNAIGSEVHVEVFGHILREDGNVFLDSDS